MKLQVKIGCGFGILVLTCLGLTIGSWVGVNALDQRQQRLNDFQSLRFVLANDVVGKILQEENLQVAGASQISSLIEPAQSVLRGCSEDSELVEGIRTGCRKGSNVLSSLSGSAGTADSRIDVLRRVRLQVEDLINNSLDLAINNLQDSISNLSLWIKRIAVFLSIVGTLVGIGISWFISRMITRPINLTIEKVQEIATGNLSIRVPVLTKDEIGTLARAMNTMTGELKTMFSGMRENSETLNGAAVRLAELSGQMTDNSRKVHADSENASAGAERLSENMVSVAHAMEDSTHNINAMVAAIEEMSATISEISRDSETGSSITESAVLEAQTASQTVAELGQAADEINKVTETITEIADQTNLLALNATIEAARAGEAGKGFAVVAHEIKELAAQTTSATKEIRARIDGVQSSSSQVVRVMGSIIETIGKVNDIVSSISHSVGEQAAASGEISGNVHQASAGMNGANENVAEASELNRVMASDLATVRQEITQLLSQCEQVARMADDQKQIAADLNRYSAKFRLG